MAGECGTFGGNRSADRVLARNPGRRGKTQIKRPRRSWNYNIKLN
jgi:hypothetical protein